MGALTRDRGLRTNTRAGLKPAPTGVTACGEAGASRSALTDQDTGRALRSTGFLAAQEFVIMVTPPPPRTKAGRARHALPLQGDGMIGCQISAWKVAPQMDTREEPSLLAGHCS